LSVTSPLPTGTSAFFTTSAFNTLDLEGFIPAGGATGLPAAVATTSNMRLSVWDFEATGLYHAGNLRVEGSAGVRYVHLDQNFGAFASQANEAGAGSQETSLLLAGHNFNGAGPTMALDLRQGLGESGFGLYANVRGAVLFGAKHANGVLDFTFTPAAGTATNDVTVYNSDSLGVIGVGECELGAEFARNLGSGASVFVRAGIDGQLWLGAGNATSQEGNLGFFGYTVTVGLNY
jgi:hypothetical protein